jgi:hypothetical protein
MDTEDEYNAAYNEQVAYEMNVLSLIAFVKDQQIIQLTNKAKQDKLERLVRKSFKLTKYHREANSIFE